MCFVDAASIMAVVVSLILIAVGVFVVFTIVNETSDNIDNLTTTTTRTENFEDDTAGANPSASWYTYAETGYDGTVLANTAFARSNPNSFAIVDSNGDEDYAYFNFISGDYERIDLWFMINTTETATNVSYIDHYNNTLDADPTMPWYNYSESVDCGTVTNDTYQLNGNDQSFNFTYSTEANASFEFNGTAKTIDYLWFGVNHTHDDADDNSMEEIRFMNAYDQEILAFTWTDGASNTVYFNGHDTGYSWTEGTWDVYTARINWTDHTVSVKMNSEQWTAWRSFNNPAVTSMKKFNVSTDGTGQGADIYVDNMHLYDAGTIDDHEQCLVNITKSNGVALCSFNITADTCEFDNSTTTGWAESLTTDTSYRLRLDMNYTDDTVLGTIYNVAGTSLNSSWLEMYDGSEAFEETAYINITGVSDTATRAYFDSLYLLDQDGSDEIPDIGGTTNSVMTILGIFIIIGAIMAMVGVIMKYR